MTRAALVGGLLVALSVALWLAAGAEDVRPLRILLPVRFAFAPCDLIVRVRLLPIDSDRVLTIAAYDVRVDPPMRVQFSAKEIAGTQGLKLAVIPWRLDPGDYAIIATIGTGASVRASAVEAFHVLGRSGE